MGRETESPPRAEKTMMRITMIAVVIAAAYVSAQETESVPEDNLFSLEDDLSEARATLQSMQAAGNSETECRKLVTDTKTEIKINVKTEQQIIDALDSGKECEVHFKNTEDEKTEVKRTEDEEKKAATEKEKAFTVEVVFGKHIFSSLTEGDCSVFFSSSSYLAAKEELIKVMEQAKKDTKKCHCDTKLKHAEANKRGHANDAANKKAWAMAHQLECVLDGKTSCSIPPCPTVTAATLTAGVNGQTDCKG